MSSFSVLLTIGLSFLLVSCDMFHSPSTHAESFKKLVSRFEKLEHQKVKVDNYDAFPNDSFSFPESSKSLPLRRFLESYVYLYGMQLVRRGEDLAVLNRHDYEKLWSNDSRKIQEASKSSKKPILIKLTANWCSPCQTQSRLFFQEGKLFSEIQEFELLEIDIDKLGSSKDDEDKANLAFLKKLNIPSSAAPLIAMVSGDNVRIMPTDDMKTIETWDFYWGELLLFRKSLQPG